MPEGEAVVAVAEVLGLELGALAATRDAVLGQGVGLVSRVDRAGHHVGRVGTGRDVQPGASPWRAIELPCSAGAAAGRATARDKRLAMAKKRMVAESGVLLRKRKDVCVMTNIYTRCNDVPCGDDTGKGRERAIAELDGMRRSTLLYRAKPNIEVRSYNRHAESGIVKLDHTIVTLCHCCVQRA